MIDKNMDTFLNLGASIVSTGAIVSSKSQHDRFDKIEKGINELYNIFNTIQKRNNIYLKNSLDDLKVALEESRSYNKMLEERVTNIEKLIKVIAEKLDIEDNIDIYENVETNKNTSDDIDLDSMGEYFDY